MSETVTLHVAENTAAYVGWKLFIEVANAEKKHVYHGQGHELSGDRKWILDTYAECLLAVTDPRARMVGVAGDTA